MAKSWREQLQEIGGYDNAFMSVHAGVVREIIQQLEESKKKCHSLEMDIVQLQQQARPAVARNPKDCS